MDKYEYKIKAEEINELIQKEDFAQAVEIADTIDWRRVKSVRMLCTISDVYKMNRRYEEAKELLEMAYDRHPGSRTICYSLCELTLKTEDYVQAYEYYKQFAQIAPKDPGKYILKYKIYTAQDISIEERIDVLKELKAHEPLEKWLYELAYLYHRLGLVSQCVDECDELITMFGSGKYVIKAMELKKLHQPLTAEQQKKYIEFTAEIARESASEQVFVEPNFDDTKVYERKSLADIPEQGPQDESAESEAKEQKAAESTDDITEKNELPQKAFLGNEGSESSQADAENKAEPEINVKVMDPGYNTINLQETVAEGIREYLGENTREKTLLSDKKTGEMMESDGDTEALDFPEISEVGDDDLEEESGKDVIERTEVFFGDTAEISESKVEQMLESSHEEHHEEHTEDAASPDLTATAVMEQLRLENMSEAAKEAMQAQPPKEIASVLSQEYDGQISFIVPETQNIERQITGQLNLDDILAEWERLKRENAEKNEQAVLRHVKEQTGEMFTEFEASIRDSLLEKLEKEAENEPDPISVDDEVEELTEIEETAYLDDEEPESASHVDHQEKQEYMEVQEDSVNVAATGHTMINDNATQIQQNRETDEAEEVQSVQDMDEAGEEQQSQENYVEESVSEEEKLRSVEASLKEADENEAEMTDESAEKDAAAETKENIEKNTEVKAGQGKTRQRPALRSLTQEEKELFTDYIQSRSAKEQLINIIDNTTMAAYTGNIIITGDEGTETMSLCKNIIKEVRMADSNFSGKIAKISGKSFNNKNVPELLGQLSNGALIVEKASEISDEKAEALYQALQNENQGIIVVLQDSFKAMNKFLEKNGQLSSCFTNRMDVQALNNDTLVAYGKQYAYNMEYSIDELGILAFHTRIEERQTLEHAVTVGEVKEIVDKAIRHANKKTLRHFFDILMAKRYDEEDMIVLGEKDFS